MSDSHAPTVERTHPDTRRQHMVPQSYLRRFAPNDDASQNPKVWVFDKTQRRVFPTTPLNIAQERDFNDLPLEVLPDDYADSVKEPEAALSRVEGEFVSILNNFVSYWEEDGIPHKIRPALAAVIAVQMARTRAMRARMTVLLSDASDVQLQSILDDQIAPTTGRTHTVTNTTTEDLASLAQLKFLTDPAQLVPLCSRLVYDYWWFVGVNEDAVALYTSDNPVAFWCEREPFEGAPDIGATSFGAPGTRVAFPVTPELLILLFERTAFPDLADNDGEIVVCPKDVIDDLNRLQVQGSYRQVFCRDSAFDLAEAMCAADATLTDPDAPIRALLNAPILDRADVGEEDISIATSAASRFSALLPRAGVTGEKPMQP